MRISVVRFRNFVVRILYKYFFKLIFFRFDPESIHNKILFLGCYLGKFYISRKTLSLLFGYSNKKLSQTLHGIYFPNPVGLAAGFDKNANLVDILPSVGFGFMEIGSVTAGSYSGNSGKRLSRLIKSKALVVNYGLSSPGCEKIKNKLENKKCEIPLGINIAKTNNKETIDLNAGISDYLQSCKTLLNIGDYLTINISCPNSPTGYFFDDAGKLDIFLVELEKLHLQKPVFIKISPDLGLQKIEELLQVSENHGIAGFICTNLTKKRNNPKIIDNHVPIEGGISGKPLREMSDEIIRHVYRLARKDFVIIGCGGIFSAEDAYRKIKLGASLVQLITGMIFEGPQLISEINLGLARLLKRDGFKNISEAVGVDNYKNE